jgi:hypothetical protein
VRNRLVVTSILDAAAATDVGLARLYAQRWEINPAIDDETRDPPTRATAEAAIDVYLS